MLTLETHEPVTVIGYGPWNETDAKFGHFVRVLVPGEEASRQFTIDGEVYGNGRPAEGASARLVLTSIMRAQAFAGRDGSPQARMVAKYRVVGFKDVKPGQAAQAA